MTKLILTIVALILVALFALSFDYSPPDKFTYGVSFSRFHADELGLDWKETYLAILNDLGVRNFRFSAHWPLTEPKDGEYNFRELDFQMNEAKNAGASVIMAVGRRLPGWPECHEPEWAKDLDKAKKQDKVLRYIEAVVNRYKNYPNILYWQVENEPHLTFFSRSACGEFEDAFLEKELDLVKKLDPERLTLITDSGEFGTWYKTYRHGDVFGTSMYLYIWWRNFIGSLRYPITPTFFVIKHNLAKLIYGNKPAIVIELSSEPWLLQPITDTPIETQLERMGVDKFNEMIEFSSKTGFDTFYLWGAEWWYWMKEKQDHPEFWNRAKEIF
ncbi:MAG: beta-galactosidase [Candidatus Yanofskybacteria bacterium]|nr:beta-galactosidase [Candidatus Yanofskybacteria bacterium]